MFTLNCKGKLLAIDSPIVMGIINVTPDSFYEGSRQNSISAALQKAEQMLLEGATILDIGGQSTKPGSIVVDEEEELNRVIPVIEAIHDRFPNEIISIDTFYAKVAKLSVNAGASIVNDISAGNMNEAMLETVADLHVPFVCMHMKGKPETMQQETFYNDVTEEVLSFLIQKIEQCKKAGIHDIIIDPGFGFGKSIQQNFELLKNLNVFKMLEKLILVGLSRKSTVYKTLKINVDEALNGTTVLNTISLLNGANILRVHDVKQAKEAITLICNIKN